MFGPFGNWIAQNPGQAASWLALPGITLVVSKGVDLWRGGPARRKDRAEEKKAHAETEGVTVENKGRELDLLMRLEGAVQRQSDLYLEQAGKIASLIRHVEELEEQARTAKLHNDILQAERDALTARVAELEPYRRKTADLEARVAKLEAQIAEKDRQLAEANAHINQLAQAATKAATVAGIAAADAADAVVAVKTKDLP